MLENLMLASKFDNLCPQFARGNSKRYSKKEDLLYGTIQLFFHYKTYIMVIFPPLVSFKVRNLCNILPYKEKTNGFLMVSLKIRSLWVIISEECAW